MNTREQVKKGKHKKTYKNNDTSVPDPETLHKTDPQDNMQGPVSSIVNNVKEEVEKNNKETKEEADKKQAENK